MVKVEAPGRDGAAVRRSAGRSGAVGVGSGAASSRDQAGSSGRRASSAAGSGRRVRRAQRSGSGSCAAAGIVGPDAERVGAGVAPRDGSAGMPVGPSAAVVRRSGRSRHVRAAARSMAAAAGTSRRSKSLPHQAHSDQSIPTSRLQFGQTRLRRVRQFGQMIHSSSIRRSQVGQWWIDSTSARSASSARFRSQTSPIFSCGRTIL